MSCEKPIAIIQARMSSTRLPGKVLKQLAGGSVLEYVVRRCRLSRRLAGVVLATTEEPVDDCLCDLAKSLGIEVFRGSRDDVLDRYLKTARAYGADPIIRITSDCPLIEPAVIDEVIASHELTRAQFVRTDGYPRGTGDADLITLSALKKAWSETRPEHTYYREHVVTYPWDHPHEFPSHVVQAPRKFRGWDYRLCIDEADDYDVIRLICDAFVPRFDFTLEEIIHFLNRNPGIAQLNRHVRQKTR